jgi:hypothetical protein
LAADLRRRVRSAVRRLAVTIFLLLVTAGLAVLALLYFIHGFFMWLATQLPMWAAALATGGFVLLLAIIVLLILLLMGKRKPPARAPAAAAVGSAAASHLMGSLLRSLSPRIVAIGLGAVAAVMLLMTERDRNRKKRGGDDKTR